MKIYIPLVILLAALTGCSAGNKNTGNKIASPTEPNATDSAFDSFDNELTEQTVKIADPIEPWNRLMFNTNDVLYFWVLKPVAQGYNAIMPKPARVGVRNFFNNLTTPVRLVSCLLQGKGHSAGTELQRFGINTTIGILGFGDPALDQYKIAVVNEDLGQTLAVYGLGNGCYMVWPLFGPSSARDSVGLVGDMFLNPVFYLEPMEAKIGISAVNITNKTSLAIGEYESFKAAAVDPYIAMRNAYIQYRNKQVKE